MKAITTEIISAVAASNNILVCGHIRPDGDCISSALAVRRLCQNMGKTAVAVCDCDKPSSFRFLPDYDGFCVLKDIDYDLFIAVDCATESRLGKYTEYLNKAKNSICIDHHPTNPGYGKINHIVPTAASTCSIIFDIFRDSEYIDKDVATMLYAGISTDTGHFMHANTTEKVFNDAAELIRHGIDAVSVNNELYNNNPFRKIKLTSRALDSIRIYGEGKIALMKILLDDLNSCMCTSEDTEGLIDYAKSIEGVEIAISVCEQPGELFRVSLRSIKANVAAVAEKFGGGGHKLAAGCIIKGNAFDVADRIVSAAARELGVKP
ncbi:MAG: bifunctional oligoribonuclease/PAP phosphatase NrnA [Clostridiales bacterium]|nr:bifunctional oligoribonuclease/PAP phosphatase NrnA [Clostridiales bacterium]